jgi:hypothetical protein
MRLIRWIAPLVVAALFVAVAPVGGSADAAPDDSPLSGIPVTGTLADGGDFTGTLNITEVAAEGGRLLGSGTLVSTADGTPVTQSVERQDLGITAAASCDILNLDLGPLHLDLLGLVVDLAPVHLDITGLTGNGKLVGNLLCAITGLLDGASPGLLASLLAQLNQLLVLA